MKLSMSTPDHQIRLASSRRSEWSWVGFGAGLLAYVVLSAVFGNLPDEEAQGGLWLALGLAPGLIGLCVGFTLATLID